ncbi:MAG: hypothetical protein MI746_07635 [Pseudomonadales bacterium]|nr:hypothetical protein [Pseudomonadales bacterium]
MRVQSKLLLTFVSLLSNFVAHAQVIDTTHVEAVMESSSRLTADLARASRSKPQFVIPLLNLEVGSRVIDIFGSGGYYSDLLARVVGEEGEAILHNNQGFEQWGINILQDRYANGMPRNVKVHTRSGINLDLENESIDGALIVMALHDLYVVPKRYNGEEYVAVGPPANVAYFYEQLMAALKPGGRFVVVDHAGEQGMAHEEVTDLHRIGEDFLREDIVAHGFRFLSSESPLRNPDDDRTRIVFDEDLQGRTDRFVLVFEKP